jgi:N-acyl-L-homoserine lactone synthetase
MESTTKDQANVLLSSHARQFALLDRADCRLAETSEDKEAIYRLRYRAYLKEGAIEPKASQRVTDRFDDMPNTWIFGVYLEGELVSSVRVSVSRPAHPETPSCEVFPDQLKPFLTAGQTIVDPTRFVVDPEFSGRLKELPFVTLRLGWIGCAHFKADIGLASVRTEHRAFYQRMFKQRVLAEARSYPGLIKPICLLVGDFPAVREKVMQGLPAFRSTHFERRKLFERNATNSTAQGRGIVSFS